jgi:translocation and assembly module TamA
MVLHPGRASAQAQPDRQPGPSEAGGEAELFAPLTPLDQFRVQSESVPPASAQSRAAIAYTVTVTGLKAVGLEDRFHKLSALEASRQADTLAQLRARASSDVDTMRRLLQSEGYYDADVSQAITPGPGPGRRAMVTLAAAPGEPYHLSEVVVTAPPTQPPGLARKALPLQRGDRLVAATVEAAEAQVTLQLPEEGYPFAKVGQRDVALHGDTHGADYTLPVQPGPRSDFGAIRTAGAPVFGSGHLGVIARFRPGNLYDSRLVDDFRRALVATDLYASVAVEPVDTGQTLPDGQRKVDLLVRSQPGPSHSLSGGIGYETGLGATVTGSWTARNMFPPEGALTLDGVLGTQEQLAGVTFLRSNAGQRDRTVQGRLQLSRQKLKAYDANSVELSGQLARQSTPLWQKRWTYSVGADAAVSDESGYDLSLHRDARRTYEVVSLPVEVGYDRSDSLLNPTRGFRLTARPTPSLSVGKGARPYFKLLTEARGYVPVTSALVLAARLRLGGLFGAAANDIAPSRRFYAGGGGSVRGFGYQELGPKDPANNPVGGGSLTETSVEARYRFGNFGVVAFLDGGQVTRAALPGFDDLRFGAGAGVRYYTNFGPLRVDVATPLSRRAGESAVGVYVSIGQAF